MQLISGWIYKQDILIQVQAAKGFPEEGEGFTLSDNVSHFLAPTFI